MLKLEVLELRDKVHELKMENRRLLDSLALKQAILEQKTGYCESLEMERDRLKVAIEHSIR